MRNILNMHLIRKILPVSCESVQFILFIITKQTNELPSVQRLCVSGEWGHDACLVVIPTERSQMHKTAFGLTLIDTWRQSK